MLTLVDGIMSNSVGFLMAVYRGSGGSQHDALVLQADGLNNRAREGLNCRSLEYLMYSIAEVEVKAKSMNALFWAQFASLGGAYVRHPFLYLAHSISLAIR